MTEKRSDYRKKNKHKKNKGFFNTIKSAFDGNDEEVDVNPEFTRSENDGASNVQQPNRENRREKRRKQGNFSQKTANSHISPNDRALISEQKGLRLKKKLNRAIFIMLVLIILVLLALFHL